MEYSSDVLVIGGGPAGLSAGLMLARARRRITIVDGGQPRNRFAAHVHGVLGHDGKSPATLAAEGRREVESYGGIFVRDDLVSVEPHQRGFTATMTDGETHRARRLLVATGLRDELPAIEGLAEQWGRGVVACPYCDGYEARDVRIGVIGSGGPFSVHQAQLLRQWSKHVIYFPFGAELLLSDDARSLDARGIAVENRATVVRVATKSGDLIGVDLADGTRVAVDKIFIAPRPVPLDDILQTLGAARDVGPFGTFVRTDATGKTSVKGVWAAGNVTNPAVNVPMAMGAGASAGTAINLDLVNEEIAAAIGGTVAGAAR